ncbi:hypothetical protein [Pararhizobium sp. LjRoot238]|uniref:hypothetical protein n=1 Tax=Pararhizobium sp. LjRoot238 TaxID=3342293 RepID=UPI003ECFA95D
MRWPILVAFHRRKLIYLVRLDRTINDYVSGTKRHLSLRSGIGKGANGHSGGADGLDGNGEKPEAVLWQEVQIAQVLDDQDITLKKERMSGTGGIGACINIESIDTQQRCAPRDQRIDDITIKKRILLANPGGECRSKAVASVPGCKSVNRLSLRSVCVIEAYRSFQHSDALPRESGNSRHAKGGIRAAAGAST